MFTDSPAAMSSASRRRCPPWSAALVGAAALNFWLSGGCALETRTGDGIAGDGREILVNASVTADTAPRDAGAGMLACKSLPLFQEKVVPHFISSCVECHDGTKTKAQAALDMGSLKKDINYSCLIALVFGANDPTNPTNTDVLQAPVLTSSDPMRPDKAHDFKFKTQAEFDAYKADLVVWLNAEKL